MGNDCINNNYSLTEADFVSDLRDKLHIYPHRIFRTQSLTIIYFTDSILKIPDALFKKHLKYLQIKKYRQNG